MSILVLLLVIASVLVVVSVMLWKTRPTTPQGIRLKWFGIAITGLTALMFLGWVAWIVLTILFVTKNNY